MTNNELTLDQLTAISGGLVGGPNGKGSAMAAFCEWAKAPWCFPTDKDKVFEIGGSSDPGGDDI
ncbi:CCRG-2 family RiPP [Synechococcus sp. AH-551-J03]|nr:CCRG-2 family RiPP [Synechococcus sp. AH-551-J03]